MGKFVKFLLNVCTCWFIAYGGFCGTAFACESNQIDVLGDGTQCELAKFSITTTELTADTEFRFYMSASGNFYVDWGDGTVDTINRANTTETLYSHTFTSAGTKMIRFGGLATGYSTDLTTATIRFGSSKLDTSTTHGLVATIFGSIGQMFPTLGRSNGQQPRFIFTFSGTQIINIPENLFAGVSGNTYKMFSDTFRYCKKLISIPKNLFSGFSGGAGDAFIRTFQFCSGLQSIPSGLFKGATGGSYQFYMTFQGCTSLTEIPDNLFPNVITPNPYLFRSLFAGCTSLSGYIPPSMFSRLIANGSQYTTDMMDSIFSNTNLSTTCPAGTVQFVTGYEDYWAGHVSCVDENLVCNSGEYFPNHWYQCEQCPENNYCVGGTYPYSETVSAGATQCPNNWYSPAGSSSVAQCGRILHVGDSVVYLRSVKQTTPSLNVQIGDDIFYGNMTTADVPMHSGTIRKLKVSYDDTTYSVYDDTVTIPE